MYFSATMDKSDAKVTRTKKKQYTHTCTANLPENVKNKIMDKLMNDVIMRPSPEQQERNRIAQTGTPYTLASTSLDSY